jgi:uncharacterized protein YcbX
VPAMALIDVIPTDDGLAFVHPALGRCTASVPGDDAETTDATVWRDTLPVRLGNGDADAFLSAALGRPVRLAFQFDPTLRPVVPKHAHDGDHVSFADGFPRLVTTDASLQALNAQLAVPVPIERFRPNLVIAGTEPWVENRWRRLRIGDVTIRLPAACARCIVVTQQPDTGERLEGDEPLTTLRAMGRTAPGKILFGENAIPDGLGTLRVGDPVEVLEQVD